MVAVIKNPPSGWTKWVKGVKRYKLLFTKQVSHGDVMVNMVTVASNTVLCM